MALEIRPFAGVSYTDANWRADYADLFNQGVLPRVTNELGVTGTASPLVVTPGTAVVQGFIIRNTSNVNVSVSTPGAATAGRVIIRITYATKTVQILAKMATGGVTTPPVLTQNTTTYEMSLASFIIQNNGAIVLTDERTYIQFNTQINPTTQLANLIGTAQLTDNSITESKIADGNVTTNKIAEGSIYGNKIASNTITNANIGARVAKLIYRQGGNGTHWNTAGESNILLGDVVMQAGSISVPVSYSIGGATITFPQTYAGNPLVYVTIQDENFESRNCIPTVYVSTLQAFITVKSTVAYTGPVIVNWLAIGPV